MPYQDFHLHHPRQNADIRGAQDDTLDHSVTSGHPHSVPPYYQHYESLDSRPAGSSSQTIPSSSNNMSTVAVSYDPRVDMSMRSPFAWSGYPEAGEMMGGQDMGHMGPGSDASGTPPIAHRSLSPPKGGLARPDDRDYKRQFAMSRRDSKTSIRARRTMSNYSASSQSPPMAINDFSPSPNMSVYSSAPPPQPMPSLMSNEPVSSVGSQGYAPAYAPEHTQASMFPGPYDYINMGYASPGFPPTPPASSLSSQFPRTPSLSEQPMMYGMPPVLPSGNNSAQEPVRVLQTRPKPQCWEHGCNGRQFSTFSNLLRHQREKSGQAAKATCPNCGAEFTRTTARNGHLAHDKCKSRRNSGGHEI